MKFTTKIVTGSLILGLNINLLACEIMSSQVDKKMLKEIRSSWQGQTIPIVDSKTYKYTSFLTAYQSFDEDMRKSFKDTVCKKNGWSGVSNYKVTWDIGDKTYTFIATYDMIDYK